MRSSNHQIIILGNRDIGESDKILYVYDFKFGKQQIIAKGARKIKSKFTGYLQTLNFCHATLYHKTNRIILLEIDLEKNYLPETNNYQLLETALRVAEITNKSLHENQTIEDLPSLIASTLTALNFSQKYDLILLTFIIKILDQSGMLPDLNLTKLNIPPKYQQLLNYLNQKKYPEIIKIKLDQDDQSYLKKIIEKLTSY